MNDFQVVLFKPVWKNIAEFSVRINGQFISDLKMDLYYFDRQLWLNFNTETFDESVVKIFNDTDIHPIKYLDELKKQLQKRLTLYKKNKAKDYSKSLKPQHEIRL